MEETRLNFDRDGYLIPYDIIQTEWNIFKKTFGFTDHRRELLNAYERFLVKIYDLLPIYHRQWIDGSFISQKSIPNDIDVVIFIPYTHFGEIAKELKQLKKEVAGVIDCYFVESFPPDHPKYEIGRSDELTWYHFLCTDRRKRLKGSLEIWFDYGNQ